MKKELGIINLTSVILFAIQFGTTLHSILEDGKVSVFELFRLWPNLKTLPSIVEAVKLAPKELADLDAEEKAYLLEYVADQLDLQKEETEAVVTSALDSMLGLVSLFNAVKAAKK